MSRAPARRSNGDRANLYSEITDRIIAELDPDVCVRARKDRAALGAAWQ
ncbi:hypothetical protein [Roseospira marina]|nr:hypothetical protein [Roseospira marina]MBB4315909.1 antirestriction protein ArdC [Roseospira marina]MBB5089045.1 antirestriction protein ArdC [Roseospira marina]